MNSVLFLGAGFSKSFGLPIMNEFFSHANAATDLDQTEQDLLKRIRGDARSANSMIKGSHTNLEHILSLSLINDFSDHSAEDSQYNLICKILLKIFRNVDQAKMTSGADHFQRLITRNGDIDGDLTIITTNYDVCADFAAHLFFGGASLPFSWRRLAETDSSSLYSIKNNRMKLCKLHGSLNWFLNNDGTVSVHDSVLHGSLGDERGERIVVSIPAIQRWNIERTPIIVPPTFSKMQYPVFMKDVWRTAASALSTAEQICFIGYSFPASDTYMRYFIASSLVENVDLESITLIDPFGDQIAERLSSSDSDFGDHFNQLIRVIKKPWINSGYNMFP